MGSLPRFITDYAISIAVFSKMKHLFSSRRDIAISVTESCWSIQFVNRDRICQVCLNLGGDKVTQVLLEGRILLLSGTAPVFCQDAGVMTKWLGNHLVSSNNKKERIAQLRNKRTNAQFPPLWPFPHKGRESAVIRKILGGTLEKEHCLADLWRLFCPHLKCSGEHSESTARNS